MAECGTDEGEDSGLSFEEYFNLSRGLTRTDDHSLTQVEIDLIFELYIDAALSGGPQPKVDLPCLQCGRLVTEEFEDTWVWIQNPRYPDEMPVFVPFCNSMHRDIYFKVGLWAELKPTGLPALSLDEDDE